MDNLSLIITAYEHAVVAKKQSMLNDATREVFLRLKNYFLMRLAGESHSHVVLNEYEQNPETWRKPFVELLTRASLVDDGEVLTQARHLFRLVNLESRDASITNVFHEQVQGSAIGNYNTNTFHITNTAPAVEDSLVRGRDRLRRGRDVLKQRDYVMARQLLEEADQCLPAEQTPQESAQVKYFRTFALLNGKRPFVATLPVMRQIEQLLRSAIALRPLSSYFYTLSIFKRDFARNGLPPYLHDAELLLQKARHMRSIQLDEENLGLLRDCQPHLMRDTPH